MPSSLRKAVLCSLLLLLAAQTAQAEGIRCEFSVFRGPVQVDENGQADPTNAIQFGQFCAGNSNVGTMVSGIKIKDGQLVEDIYTDLLIAYTPNLPVYRMRVFRKDSAGNRQMLADDFVFSHKNRGAREELAGTVFSYDVNCTYVEICEQGSSPKDKLE